MRYKTDNLPIAWLFLLIFLQYPANTFCQKRELNDTLTRNNFIWDSKTVRISSVPIILFAGSAATWGVREDVRTLRIGIFQISDITTTTTYNMRRRQQFWGLMLPG